MAIRWFGGGKSDHPLADDKGVREVLESLPANDAAKAIEELRHWIEPLGAGEGLPNERCAELMLRFDEAAQPRQRKLGRDYLANPRLPKFQESRLRGALFGLWKDLGAGYTSCMARLASDPAGVAKLKARLPLLSARAVRAAANRIKWHYMNYEQGDADGWRTLGVAYRFAEAAKVQRESVALYPGAAASSSAEREFVKALMLAASAPDCLVPLDIELAERIAEHFSGDFLISPTHQPQATYHWIDLGAGAPPKRLTQMPGSSPGLRFFAAGGAIAKLDDMIRMVEGGGLPSGLNLGGTYEPGKVLDVLRHLKVYWAATPPVRKHDRYAVQHRLTVVNGFDGVVARVRDGGDTGAESWVSDNVSAGGIGAVLQKAQGDWLRIGRLVGLSVEGGSGACSVGVVRRCSRLPQQQLNVGIRTFAKEVFAVTLSGALAREGLLLNDGRALKDEVRIVHREGEFDRRASPTLQFDGSNHLLIPIELSETGEDFEVARYRVMRQS